LVYSQQSPTLSTLTMITHVTACHSRSYAIASPSPPYTSIFTKSSTPNLRKPYLPCPPTYTSLRACCSLFPHQTAYKRPTSLKQPPSTLLPQTSNVLQLASVSYLMAIFLLESRLSTACWIVPCSKLLAARYCQPRNELHLTLDPNGRGQTAHGDTWGRM
jgi:hypothetical protein